MNLYKTIIVLFLTLGCLLCSAERYPSSNLIRNDHYLLLLPNNHKKSMIVALYGSGETMDDYLKNWQDIANKRGYVVCVPKSLNSHGWGKQDEKRIMEILEKLKKEYAIQKVLLSGASAGGHFALYLGINYYNDFDAIATFMGLAIGRLGKNIKFQTDSNKQIPILLIHGQKDQMIPLQYARWNYQWLLSKGYDVSYWEEPDMKHEHYRKKNKDILDWFEDLAE